MDNGRTDMGGGDTCRGDRRRTTGKRARLALGLAAGLAGLGVAGGPAASPAAACGGLFCDNAQPVNQAAERILFVDNGDGSITAAIEIMYEGPSEQFAWVLPLPDIQDPDENIRVSSVAALDRLQQATNPVYRLQVDFDGTCDGVNGVGLAQPTAARGPSEGDFAGGDGGVVVEAAGSVGPFDYELISVDKDLDDAAMVAVMWLEDNGYDVTGIGADLLRPYLESDNKLLAVRLTKGNDAGSVRPLMITYQGDKPSIPIRPTAVAANDDMGIMVWVGGTDRAIPLNYNLLELNEARINWFNPTPGYNDLIIDAADEAGGHGFVTEYAQSSSNLEQIIVPDWQRQEWMRFSSQQFRSGIELYQEAQNNFGGWDGMTDALRAALTLPDNAGFTLTDVINCPGCYIDETGQDPSQASLDVNTLRTQIYELVVRPMFETEDLVQRQAYITRLYTTLSAEEMTMDPAFDFNPDLDDVDNNHNQTRIIEGCGFDGPWRIEFDDDIVVRGEGMTWPEEASGPDMPATVRILEATTKGLPAVTRDNSERIRKLLSGEEVGPIDTNGGSDEGGAGSGGGSMATGGDDGSASSGSDGGLCSLTTPGGNAGGPAAPLLSAIAALGLALATRRRRR